MFQRIDHLSRHHWLIEALQLHITVKIVYRGIRLIYYRLYFYKRKKQRKKKERERKRMEIISNYVHGKIKDIAY